MSRSFERSLFKFTVAVAATAVVFLLRWLLEPVLAHRLPFVTLHAAVAVAVWYGGLWPAVLSTLLGYVAAYQLIVVTEPLAPMTLDKPAGQLGLAAYLVTNVIIIALGQSVRTAQRRTEAAARDALAEQRKLELEMAERRSTASALRAKEAELALVTSRTPQLLTRCSRDLRYVFVNRAAAEFLGRPPEDIIGRPLVELLGEEAMTALAPHVARVLAGEDIEFEIEVPYRDAGRRIMHAAYTPDRGERGEVIGWLASISDVTEARQAERALRESEQRFREKTEALRQADRRKDEFLAILAHELRNPLAPVWNAVQLLKMKGPDTPEMVWAREVIDRQMQQMTRLIDDLMDVARITRNRIELRRERTELATVLKAAIETSLPQIDAASQRLDVDLPPESVVVDGDPTRLSQVFSNLLNNAAKYSERGGRIVLAASCEGAEAVVSVRDEGLGIPPEMLPRVFDPFTQVNRSLDRSQGGLGIGLALVKSLVEMHGGRVTARSEGAGRGSEFIVRLPLAAAIAPRLKLETPPTPVSPRANAGCRVLVVDDNADAAESLALVLGALGYVTRTAFDGLAGLAAAAEFRPDVALLDIGMPGLNGFELAVRLRQEPWGQGMVLVAVTGWGQPDDKLRTREAGFDHHLVKPVEPAALAQLLAAVTAAS